VIDVLRARRRIAPYVRRTPLVESAWLWTLGGARVWMKLESLQRSCSFKARGAFNAVLARRERAARPSPLVTASAGNHGRALAEAAETFGVPLVVFTPAGAPEAKLSAIRRHAADLRAIGRDYEDAERLAKAFARDTGAEFISGYNDADIIDGAATIALEICEDAPTVRTLVVPVGGGGLIAGIARTAKSIAPGTTVVGVEVSASCAFQASVRAGRIVTVTVGPTLADGLSGNPDPETMTFEPIRRFVDRIVTVEEDELARAIVGLVEHEHLVAEGAGAVGIAALASGRVGRPSGDVALVISGSNIDGARLRELFCRAATA
jgi:threonine dehydratase